MTSADDHLFELLETGTTEKLRENLPPRLEDCQEKSDKEQQRLTKRK